MSSGGVLLSIKKVPRGFLIFLSLTANEDRSNSERSLNDYNHDSSRENKMIFPPDD